MKPNLGWLCSVAVLTGPAIVPVVARAHDGPAERTGPVLCLAEPWANRFAGRETVLRLRATGLADVPARLVWRFAAGGATLQRGEQELPVRAGLTAEAAIRLQLPPARADAILQCEFTAELLAQRTGERLAGLERAIHVFPEDPFAGRRQWLESLDIRLFDSDGRTAKLFERAEIPFRRFSNLDAAPTPGTGLLIVGEGVSFRDHRALAGAMVAAAERGRTVLFLAPGGGELPLPEPVRLVFRGEDAIRELDKRLDAAAWPEDGKVRAGAMRLKGERGPVVMEVTDGPGWPWVEMAFESGGTMAICGFAIVAKWEAGPAPRFLLARILESLARRGLERSADAQGNASAEEKTTPKRRGIQEGATR